MAKYKLTYFDIDGGRAEPIRIAFHAAGIEFEDHRISFDEFSEMRSGRALYLRTGTGNRWRPDNSIQCHQPLCRKNGRPLPS